MSNFWKRAITGTLFLVVMIGGIIWCYWSLCALFLLIALLGLHEFYKLIEQAGISPQKWIGMAAGALIFLVAISSTFLSPALIFVAVPFMVAIFFAELFRDKVHPFQNIAFTLLGIIYVVFPFAAWAAFVSPTAQLPFSFGSSSQEILTVHHAYNPHIVLGFFIMLWVNDTGAYITGMSMGKHKLWERISPKKTWEGFIGGVILSAIAAYILSAVYKESTILWIIISLIVSVFGTLGDLVESMFKRSINIKESGGILPGHGGILDRFDGVLLTTPLVISMLVLIQFAVEFLTALQ